jgi:DNA adenine methylase
MDTSIDKDIIAYSPPLKWAGGKRWLVPHLRRYWEKHSNLRLVEPLCGGLAVALGLLPDKALLNDINPHLINFYLWVKMGLKIELPMIHDKEIYYKYRKRFNSLIEAARIDSKEAAEIFYYLNRTGYNGLCRFNKKGYYNVPFGRYNKINYRYDFSHYQKLFTRWEFSCVDFEHLSLKDDDFIYADPPYDVDFTSYSAGGFSWADQVRFANWVSMYNGPVVLSNQATTRIIELYDSLGFRIKFMKAPRRINCNGSRIPAREILATKGLKDC